MNILIADSGSTTTEWILMEENVEQNYFKSSGLNPYFASNEQLSQLLEKEVKQQLGNKEIGAIYFYGSGCGRNNPKEIMQKVLSATFPGAKVTVEDDLLGAGRACLGKNKGIICILGTGSNAGWYDGEKIVKRVPSLGFILGDEGSGGYFGKQIIHDYFYDNLPGDLRKEIEKNNSMELEDVLSQVYKKEGGANHFVASFAKMLGDFPEHPYTKKIIREGFSEFVDYQISYFNPHKETFISFSGSIAAVHEKILREVLEERGLNVGPIVRSPVKKLADYHYM